MAHITGNRTIPDYGDYCTVSWATVDFCCISKRNEYRVTLENKYHGIEVEVRISDIVTINGNKI